MSNAIVKTLQLSTAHISERTNDWIKQSFEDSLSITIYEKSIYGWLILVPQFEGDIEGLNHIPDDLRAVIEYALSHECTWAMLDCDADRISELPQFDW